MSALITELTWWQFAMLGIYSIYVVVRAFWIFNSGLKLATVGYGAKSIKLYHILWAIIDIPAIILGTIFPVLKAVFSIPVIPLKQDKK